MDVALLTRALKCSHNYSEFYLPISVICHERLGLDRSVAEPKEEEKKNYL